ncbi:MULTISPECIES: helix-turn-helix domain-containing protein [unclassified Nostoc]|jgi:transcriptional regulator with XRE-family HTH domain|uniref:helix-turn-helix domain-containing protein n=1 Tax=unclassified Nostoc TaxID=2593658 RepID=UPI00083DC259|nr:MULTISPECIES: helix-turn-helix transcriptional regulator [unclassified Nostoc]MDZ8061704.1 helix-turn-helix transcriptional regulator [Nostoc sp. EkiNYC01]MEA5600431.1 helix-turn-helix transcriptional regulator [Nostoc sp. UHCC 0252]MEA5621458.1 helix-turn-helix transcriptional regulator [Nostoc sp. UHCC 0251]ODG98405.1 XRE family transcriptional regulator [Nostoc sp. KVJ20]OYE02174.1 XRE family transcriptional regulator [Nostoc sp. 'Peltigera membranacea cyanobiont' 232]
MTEAKDKKAIIASRIREARKMAGLSQAQVAQTLGLHRPSISEIEAGKRNASAEEITKLAEIFDVSVSWLLGEGANKVDVHDNKLQLAARELQKLKPEDLDRLLTLLASMRTGRDNL